MTDAMEVDNEAGFTQKESLHPHEDSQLAGKSSPAWKESRAMTSSTAENGADNLIEAGKVRRSPPPRPTTAAAAEAADLPTKQNILSRGDLPQENRPSKMTIIQENHEASNSLEAMAVDMENNQEDHEAPINLVRSSREEAVNLSKSRDNNAVMHGLSVKMRLKKQRLEAVTRAAAENAASTSAHRPLANFCSDNSALHRLAEVAERKQEEEMLEMGEGLNILPFKLSTLLPPARQSNDEMTSMVSITPIKHTPSPDSAIHSQASYSPTGNQSPVQSRNSPFSLASLSRHNSDASSQRGSPNTLHLSSPHDSPVQMRHHFQGPVRSLPNNVRSLSFLSSESSDQVSSGESEILGSVQATSNTAQPGISRQQLINSPCPVCGDKISGFHYGIFSCESCKGFFKRTVQNKKNYQCLRGANCPVSIVTRKKCPACRFNKCLTTGMKLEAIREDRTRGGRSTYQCSYTLPAGISQPPNMPPSISLPTHPLPPPVKAEDEDEDEEEFTERTTSSQGSMQSYEETSVHGNNGIPLLIKEIMDVEHLWFSTKPHDNMEVDDEDQALTSEENMVQTLTNMADKRLFKLVKWCKSLPLFKSILIDDQISLLINAWCELLVFSCCYRSMNTPGVIRVSNQKSLTLEAARQLGIEKWIEKMLHFSEQLRRLKVDGYEYVSMKVIVLLTSDASGLKEPNNVRESQEKVVQALQHYTASQYPDMPSKFAELLLRMPELHRVCQGCKEMLCPRQPSEGEMPGFNLLMELLRGDH